MPASIISGVISELIRPSGAPFTAVLVGLVFARQARNRSRGFLYLIPAFRVGTRPTGPALFRARDLTTPHPVTLRRVLLNAGRVSAQQKLSVTYGEMYVVPGLLCQNATVVEMARSPGRIAFHCQAPSFLNLCSSWCSLFS